MDRWLTGRGVNKLLYCKKKNNGAGSYMSLHEQGHRELTPFIIIRNSIVYTSMLLIELRGQLADFLADFRVVSGQVPETL